jgi:hypothetical protein
VGVVLPLLDAERGLLNPGLELLPDLAEVLIGVDVGVLGLDLIDRLDVIDRSVDISLERLQILFGGGSGYVRRLVALYHHLFHLFGVLPFLAPRFLAFGRARKTFLVEIVLDAEDLFIGLNVLL